MKHKIEVETAGPRAWLDRIIAAALHRRGLVLLAAAGLGVAGFFQNTAAGIDVFPDLDRPIVTVIAEAHGLSATEVETLVAMPLEASLLGAPGVTTVRSDSKRGVAKIQVQFGWERDIYLCRQIVAERLGQASAALPDDVRPELGPISSIMGEILLIGITHAQEADDAREAERQLRELRVYAEWDVRRRLLAIPGVANVTVLGGYAKEYHMQIEAAALENQDLSLSAVRERLRGVGENTGGGFLDVDGREWIIRNLGSIYALSELEQATIGQRAGAPLAFKAIGRARIDSRARRGDAGVNGGPGVIVAVQKQPGASTLELTAAAEKALAELERQAPFPVRIDPQLFQQKRFIERAIENVYEAIRDGSIILVLVLAFFLWNVRTALITLTALPLSLIAATLVLQIFGFELNTMTLGGLAIAVGELVDDAIVDVENVFRRLRENRTLAAPRPALQVVFDASREIRRSIVLATLIVALVFLPLLFLPGLEGRLFQPLAAAYITALVASLLVALTVTPALAYFLLQNPAAQARETWLLRTLKNWQRRNLERLLARPLAPIAAVVLLFCGALTAALYLDRGFLPEFNEGTLTLEVFAPVDSSLETSAAKGRLIEARVLAIPGVRSVARRTGRAEGDEHAEGVYYSELDVVIAPEEAATTRAQLEERVRSGLDQIEGVTYNIGQPISHRLDHMMTGVRADAAVFLYGAELRDLQYGAYQTRGWLEEIDGVADLRVQSQTEAPELKIAIDHGKAARYGLSPAEAVRLLETLLAGEVVGRIREGNRFYPVVLRLRPEDRAIESIRNLTLKHLPDGTAVRAGMLADIYASDGPYEIRRVNGERRIAVQFNVTGRDATAVLADVRARLDEAQAAGELPGLRHSLGGRLQEGAAAAGRIVLLGLLSLALIAAALYASFRSAALTAQILLNVPFAMIGAVAALWIAGLPLTVAAFAGFIALTGIASRNGILMIAHFEHLMQYEGEAFSQSMVIRGALERLAPVLMTAGTAALALLPILLGGSEAPGKEILYPVAVVITGGLITSTAIDLAFTPVLYYHIARRLGLYPQAAPEDAAS